MPYVRTVSMEQRWQDLANLLSLPNPGEIHPFGAHHALPNYGHPHAHAHPATTYDARGVLLHNATLPTPMGDLNSTMPYGNLGKDTFASQLISLTHFCINLLIEN